jgi:autotransporter translocation and assembly factor TamB
MRAWRIMRGLVRGALRLTLGLLVFTVLLVAGSLAALQVDAVKTSLVRAALERVNPLFEGDIAVERVEGSLLGGLSVAGLRVDGPDGAPCLEVARLSLSYDLWALLEQRVHVDEILISGPDLTLLGADGEVGVAQAFAPTEPSPPPPNPDAPPPPWRIEITHLALEAGALRVSREPAAIAASELTLQAALQIELAPVNGGGPAVHWQIPMISARLAGLPVEALRLATTGALIDGGISLSDLSVEADGHGLSLAGRVDDLAAPRFDLGIRELRAALPALMTALGGPPLEGDARVHGAIRGPLDALVVDLDMNTAAGPLRLAAGAAVGAGPLEAYLSLTSPRLQPRALFPDLGVDLAAGITLSARLVGDPLAGGRADVDLRLTELEVPAFLATGAAPHPSQATNNNLGAALVAARPQDGDALPGDEQGGSATRAATRAAPIKLTQAVAANDTAPAPLRFPELRLSASLLDGAADARLELAGPDGQRLDLHVATPWFLPAPASLDLSLTEVALPTWAAWLDLEALAGLHGVGGRITRLSAQAEAFASLDEIRQAELALTLDARDLTAGVGPDLSPALAGLRVEARGAWAGEGLPSGDATVSLTRVSGAGAQVEAVDLSLEATPEPEALALDADLSIRDVRYGEDGSLARLHLPLFLRVPFPRRDQARSREDLASGALASVDVWEKRMPDGHLDLSIEAARFQGFGVDGLTLNARLTGKGRALTIRGPLDVRGLALGPGRRLEASAVELDVTVDPRRLMAEGVVNLRARALKLGPETRVDEVDVELGLRPEARGQTGVKGELRVQGAWLDPRTGIGDLTGVVDLIVGQGLPSGRVALTFKQVEAVGRPLDTAILTASRDTDGATSLALSAAREDLSAKLALSASLPDDLGDDLRLTVEALALSDRGVGFEVTPGGSVHRARDGRVQISGLHLNGVGPLKETAFDVEAVIDPGARALSGQVTLANLDVEAWLEAGRQLLGSLMPALPPLAGRVDGAVTLSGSFDAPSVATTLDIQDARLGDVDKVRVGLEASAGPDGVTLIAKGGWGKTGKLNVRLALPAVFSLGDEGLRVHLPGDAPIDVWIDASRFDMAMLRPFVPTPSRNPLKGMANTLLRFNGTLQDPRVQLDLNAFALTYDRVKDAIFDSRVVFEEDKTHVKVRVVQGETQPLILALEVPTNLVRTAQSPDGLAFLRDRLSELPFTFSLHLDEIALKSLPLLTSMVPALSRTRVAGDLSMKGTLATPDLRGKITASGLPLGDLEGRVTLDLKTFLNGRPIGAGRATRPAGVAADDHYTLVTALELLAGDKHLGVVELRLPDLPRVLTGGDPLTLLDHPDLGLDVSLEYISLAHLAAVSPEAGENLAALLQEGGVTVRIKARGAAGGPRVTVDARAINDRAHRAGAYKAFAKKLDLHAEVDPAGTKLRLDVEQDEGGGSLTATGELGLGSNAPFDGALDDVLSTPFSVTARSVGFDLEGLSTFLPTVFGPSRGRLEIVLDASGTFAAPKVRGSLAAHFDELVVLAAGWYDRDVDMRVDLHPDRVHLHPVHLEHDGGSLDLSFDLAIPAFDPKQITLDGAVSFERFDLVRRDDLKARATGEIQIGGVAARPAVTGAVKLLSVLASPQTGGRSVAAIGLPEDVVLVSSASSLEEARILARQRTRAAGLPVDLDLQVDIPARSVHIENEMLDLWLAGDVHIATKADQPSLSGQVTVVQGQIEFYGLPFTVKEDSRVVFMGGTAINPVLDVRTAYDISHVDLSPIGLEATPDSHLTIAVSGTAAEPKLDLSSDPPMDESNIVSIMLMGEPVNASQSAKEEAGVERQAMNLVVGLATGKLARMLTKDLPIDVLKVEAGEQGLSSARISVGKRLTRDLVVIYTSNLSPKEGEENEDEVRVQYRLTRLLQVETYLGDAGIGGVDLLVRWRF